MTSPKIEITTTGSVKWGNKMTPLTKFMDKIGDLAYQDDTGPLIIPSGVRYVQQYRTPGTAPMLIAVLEIPTGVYTMDWLVDYDERHREQIIRDDNDDDKFDQQLTKVRLALPYVIMPCVFLDEGAGWGSLTNGHFGCYFSNTPLQSLETMLYPAILPNCQMHYYGKQMISTICPSYDFIYGRRGKLNTLNEWIGAVRSDFFGSTWNKFEDVTTNYDNVKQPLPITPVHNWIKHTAKDPSFITKVDWPDNGASSLIKVINSLVKLYQNNRFHSEPDVPCVLDLANPIFQYKHKQ